MKWEIEFAESIFRTCSKERNIRMNVPQHVAIILDGNGRWAKSKGMPRNYGHAQGSKNVERICEEAWRMGIKYLTVYAFSTENWSRPESEVSALMTLLRNYMKTCLKTAAKNDMKIRVIGDITPLDDDIKKRIRELEEATVNNGGLNFTIALNYGSRDEMARAAKKLAKDCVDGKVDPEQIDESVFASYLDTREIPDPDLLIRTSGEQRLSNYLLWQLAYSEFYFTDVPWPAFTKEELKKAIDEFNHRHRRFGGVEEE
nr:isoprenyl transferase [uncultured Mediterraneibacter sp.]